ncbi:YfiR family protein [Hyalangium gracile]|uniref:YfiR family protein n=1 Tax=Hyalangium gracile TaxID=394092 RepID=UPI001CCDFAE4|nr:YfiR family protein [Hyalangium gracile]
MKCFPIRAATLLMTMLMGAPIARAADDLAPGRQAALLLRVLPYDRTLKQRAREAVTVAVLHRDGQVASAAYAIDMTAALQDFARAVRVRGLPVRVIGLPYSSPEKLEAELTRAQVTAAYVCPGLTDVSETLMDITRRRKILTFSGRESDIREHFSIGLIRRGTKAALLVNLPEAQAEGAELEPEMLAMSEVLR